MTVNFDFLDNLELETVEKASAKIGVLDRQPLGKTIRIYADGKVFPSKELITAYNLEYQPKGAPDQGNGFDVFSTSDWGQWPEYATSQLVILAAVPKGMAKVDMFAGTRYADDGEPRAQVGTQGSATFGKHLIEMLNKTYNTDIFENGMRPYVDLQLIEDKPLKPVANGIYNIPKPITKGAKSGTMGYERRESLTLIPLVIMPEIVEPEAVAKTEEVIHDATPEAKKEVVVTLNSDRDEDGLKAEADVIPEALENNQAEVADALFS